MKRTQNEPKAPKRTLQLPPLPRGLNASGMPDGSVRLRWRQEGRYLSRTFRTKAEAQAFITSWKERKAANPKLLFVPGSKARVWDEFSRITNGADPLEVAKYWLRHGGHLQGGRMKLSEAVSRYLKGRASNVTGDSLSHLKLHLKRLADFLDEDRALQDISQDDIQSWVENLGEKQSPDGFGFSSITCKHHLKSARSFFNFAFKNDWILRRVADADMVKVAPVDEVTILTVEEAIKLFEENKTSLIVPLLALEAFGGLRYTSAVRLEESDINFADRGILLRAKVHKSGRRHYVQGMPDNLWPWLERAPQATWELTQRQCLKLKSEAFARAGVPHPHNVLRHSFCSYHCALHGSADKTATLMQHQDSSKLWSNYKANATRENAERYFQIVP